MITKIKSCVNIERIIVRTIQKKIQEKFENLRLQFVGGVAFWNYFFLLP